MEGDPKQVELVHGGFVVRLQLLPSSLTIEVSVRADNKLFYTTISKDSMTEQLTKFFDRCSEIFDFIASGNFEIEEPSKVNLLIRVVNKVSKIPIHLAERVLTRELVLDRQVKELDHKLTRFKRQMRDLHNIIEELRRQITEERKQRTQREKQNIVLRQQLKESETKVTKLQNSFRDSDKSNKQLTHTVAELKQLRQEDRLNYEAIILNLQQELAQVQHQPLPTGQKGAKKQEVLKPNKQTIPTKLVTIKGNGYDKLYEQVAKAKDKQNITELRLENTQEQKVTQFKSYFIIYEFQQQFVSKIADEMVNFTSVRKLTLCFQHNLFADDAFTKLANSINGGLSELESITISIPNKYKQYESSKNWTQQLKIKPTVNYY